jgi:hypothetical protein
MKRRHRFDLSGAAPAMAGGPPVGVAAVFTVVDSAGLKLE